MTDAIVKQVQTLTGAYEDCVAITRDPNVAKLAEAHRQVADALLEAVMEDQIEVHQYGGYDIIELFMPNSLVILKEGRVIDVMWDSELGEAKALIDVRRQRHPKPLRRLATVGA